MRILLSAASSADGPIVDLALDCEDEATVGDVARALAMRVAGPTVPILRQTGRRLNVVAEESILDADEPPELWVRGTLLDPAQPVASSLLRHGELVGVGVCLPDLFAEPDGLVEVRVTSGPGAGAVHRLGPGRHEIGADERSAIVVPGPGIAPLAATLDVHVDGTVVIDPHEDVIGETVPSTPRRSALEGPIVVAKRDGDTPGDTAPRRRRRRGRKRVEALSSLDVGHESIDPNADRALLELDRREVREPRVWTPGLALTVGRVMLELSEIGRPDAALTPSPDGATLDFNRPPRLSRAERKTEFAMPKEPQRPEKMPLPWPILVAPILMGGAMYAITQRPYTLLFIALSPLMMIANFSQGRRTQKKRYVRAKREFEEKTRKVERDAFTALLEERAHRREDIPDPARLLLFATGPRRRLWERRRVDPDWLTVRVGTADVPSEVKFSDPARERHEGPITWTAPDVPVTVHLEKMGVTGVAAPAGRARRLGRWLVAQAAGLHSPADLRIVVLADRAAEQDWSWVRWLPHVRPDVDSGVLAAVGTDEETTARRLGELVRELEARQEAAATRQGVRLDPMLVVLDGARSLRLLGGMVPLLQSGPQYGMTFLCLDDDVTLLPEECRAVVTGDESALRVEVTNEEPVEAVRPDWVGTGWCERLGRSLAPIKDVSGTDAAATLPTSSRLLSVLRLDPPDGERIAKLWAQGGRTTAAVIGEGADGPFELDIRRDGPHGLVAGTTGSGKSELLQTIIASLAVGNRPDEMTFVLVDYKGGAAFKDCAHLPHTVGMVTDLDGHLTSRALESLGAELRRREHRLARAGAKDIEDYVAGRGPDDEPMPRLLIVIDEFAALVAELPDFVTGLVDIARRGRSLGVHLILATQRPAGVVSAEIKSNTNLRIALRVTDAGDSQDVIESEVAAHIAQSTPGRAYARLGHSSLMPFQSARVGGRPRQEDEAADVDVRDLEWRSLGTPRVVRGTVEEEDDVSVPTDLAALVDAISGASASAGIQPPPSPWLPALPELVTASDLAVDDVAPAGDIPPIPLGLADLPSEQRQEPMTWDLADGSHLAVAGQSRSGRSSVLRLVAAGIARHTSPKDVHVYGIDCGNNALLPLLDMPHVGAVVGRDQPDRLRRLLALLGREVSRRQQLLATQGYGDIREQRRTAATAEDQLPYLVVLLDRWEGYVAQFEQSDGGMLIEQLMQLLREGAAAGLRAVFTGDKTLVTARMGAVIEDRLLLRMPAAEDYAAIGMRSKDVPTRTPAGRAFRGGEVPREVQLALLTDDPAGTAQVAALKQIAAEAAQRAGTLPSSQRPARVDELPIAISYEDALALDEQPPGQTALVAGVGGDTLGLRTVDVLVDGPGFLVLGPPRSGRSSALQSTVEFALAARWQVVIVAPRRSPLRALERRRGVRGVFTGSSDAADVRAALEVKGRRLLVVDDFEVLGADHAIATYAEEYLKSIRDSEDGLLVACGIDEAPGMYRGVTATMRKSRTGLILSPRSSTDGDVLSARLPRSVGGVAPTGRGVLVTTQGWEWVQVPQPPQRGS
ncbi:MAG TPA: FtsK/SpoIIIE domain-containing protein [Jiangellaceae bacterium]